MVRGILSPALRISICGWLLGNHSEANPASFVPTQTSPDLPPQGPPAAPRIFRESSDLDGTYLWLGPSGAASRIDDQWDSTFGIDASVVRVREHEPVAAIGGTVGASKWTVREGGRIWAEALVGTSILGHVAGLSAGPIVELSDVTHPHVGGSIGLWTFVGVTPYARVGTVDGMGNFAEIGVHIALPAIRR
jgi:hypothetical protein